MLDYISYKGAGKVKFRRVEIVHENGEVSYGVHLQIEQEDGTFYNEVFTKDSVNLEIKQLENQLNLVKQFKSEAEKFIHSGKSELVL